MDLLNNYSPVTSITIDGCNIHLIIMLYDTLEAPPIDKPIMELSINGCVNLNDYTKELEILDKITLCGIEVVQKADGYTLIFSDDQEEFMSVSCDQYFETYRKLNESEWLDLVTSFHNHSIEAHNKINNLKTTINNVQTKLEQRINKQSNIIEEKREFPALKERAILKKKILIEISHLVENEKNKNA